MTEKTEIKITRTYSLDPAVIAWATKKAALLTVENGKRTSDSQVVNDILRDAMEEDLKADASLSPTKSQKKTNNAKRNAPAAVAA